MKILTAAQVQRIDRLTTERYGVPSLSLMENAGRRALEFVRERFAPLAEHRIAILCGRGNNGGDGLVAARLMRSEGLIPRVVLLSSLEASKGDAAVNLKRLAESGAPEVAENLEAWRSVLPTLTDTTLLIDAVLGTGLSKPLEGFLLEVVRDINRDFPTARIVSIDLPSGVSADTGDLIGECVHADATVTFTAPKLAHVFPPACEFAGEWAMKQIGTPLEALEQDPELRLNLTCRDDMVWVAQRRSRTAHKGTYGHVLVLAGSLGKTGSAALAAKAALRAGAGLVTVATPERAMPVVASLGMEYMTEPLPETASGTIALRALDDGRLDKLVEGKSVLAIGPGLGNLDETTELVRAIVNRYDVPVVLDADGLNAFAGRMTSLGTDTGIRVLTPHPGELARLTGLSTSEIQARRIEVARDFAMRHRLHLVLKGFRSLVAAPDGQVWVNPTGNPGMATGGTGDVLTGVTAGLLAQFLARPVDRTVAAAVYLHGLAGDIAAADRGEMSMVAGDLLEALPRAFQALRDGADHHP